MAREQERDFLLSSILSLESLAKGGKLTNENVLAVTTHVLGRIKPSAPRKEKSSQEMFGADATCLATMLHLVSLAKGMQDGPFKAGFELAIEEAGAYLDSKAADGGTQAQTLMEQMLGLVNGSYCLIETPQRPLGVVATPTDTGSVT
ncbi:MAG TPA: hypothetical protein VJL90_03605 [Pseudorhodoplanes sp.]|nr:hypothetical protein [Pseudorhodoplanes sp.]